MKKTFLITIILMIGVCVAYAQQPFLHKSFDNQRVDLSQVNEKLGTAEDNHQTYTSTFSKGLIGNCLNLSNDVAVRIPHALSDKETLTYDKTFAIEVWVKTKNGARQGTPIMSNKKVGDKYKAGWILGTSDNGAWNFNISDGKSTYNYVPTAKQAINDGEWHHLAVSVDYDKKELWFYHNGRNVGVYNAEGLGDATSELATIIGGSDEYSEWSSRREWTAFNGMIDEVKMYNSTLSPSQVSTAYNTIHPSEENRISIPSELKVQVWNIWHGGHRFGEHVGLERTIDVLKSADADVIGLIETYGSGEIIADSLGYYFYLISSNLSIMSRYPIDETIKVFKSFNSGGAILDMGNGKKLAFFDIWIDYLPDVSHLINKKVTFDDFMKDEDARRGKEMREIMKQVDTYSQNADNVPVIMVGDFNSGSHFDWTEENKDIHEGFVVEWPAAIAMANAKYIDSYRKLNTNIQTDLGYTWSPLSSTTSTEVYRDRIDFIYYKGKSLSPYWSRVVDYHPVFWSSDHASVITKFYLDF